MTSSGRGRRCCLRTDSAFMLTGSVSARSARRSSDTSQTRRDSEEGEENEDEEQQENRKDPNKVEWEENDPHNPQVRSFPGLVLQLDETDGDGAQNWSVRYKWIVTILCAQATLVVTFASSAPSSATQQVRQSPHSRESEFEVAYETKSAQVAADFNAGREVSQLITALFLAGCMSEPDPFCLLVYALTCRLANRRCRTPPLGCSSPSQSVP